MAAKSATRTSQRSPCVARAWRRRTAPELSRSAATAPGGLLRALAAASPTPGNLRSNTMTTSLRGDQRSRFFAPRQEEIKQPR